MQSKETPRRVIEWSWRLFILGVMIYLGAHSLAKLITYLIELKVWIFESIRILGFLLAIYVYRRYKDKEQTHKKEINMLFVASGIVVIIYYTISIFPA